MKKEDKRNEGQNREGETEKKISLTISDLKEWLEYPNRIEKAYLAVISEIESRAEETSIRKSIICEFDYLDNWYCHNFVYEMLTKGTSSYRNELVSNSYHVMMIAGIFAEKNPDNPPRLMSFEYIAWWLANCVIHKWHQESETLLKIINNGLHTKFLHGGPDFKMTAWFIIEMVAKGHKQGVDYKQFNYPKDMKVYQQALAHWDTDDMDFLDKMISTLCDYHLSQASYGSMANNAGLNDPAFLQFSTTVWFVYAFEILTWLRIREQAGLKNPENLTHPLMNIPLNKLPDDTISRPRNELFERILLRLKE